MDDVVYIARSRTTGLVKIGFSRDPARRLDELALRHGPLDLLLCLAGDRADEKALHRRFAGHAVGHEWFRPHAALNSWLGVDPDTIPRQDPCTWMSNNRGT